MGQVHRASTIRAVLLLVLGATVTQFSSIIAMQLFNDLGVLGTSGLRMALAAVVLLLVFRPKVRGRTMAEWLPIVAFGASMAAGNICIYFAIDRIPLGVATTIDFLGPCIVALFASRSVMEGVLALVAFAGVVLIAGFGGPFDTLGLLFAGGAGLSFGLYTLLAVRVGKSIGGVSDVALAVLAAAVLTLPFSVPAGIAAEPGQWLMLLGSAILGTAIPYSVDTLAGKLTSARIVGVLFAFDPVVGTILGLLVLGQVISASALVGMLLVILAGAGIVWFSGKGAESPDAFVEG